MSRTTLFDPIHLTVQRGRYDMALVVSSESYPGRSVTMTHEEFYTLWLCMRHLLSLLKTGNEHNGSTYLKKLPYDTLLRIFSFLYADIARLAAPQLTEYEQVEALSLALQVAHVPDDPEFKHSMLAGSYFRFNYNFDVTPVALLKAARDADLAALKYILEKTPPEKRCALLSTPEGAHYSETRLDTALKLALASGDEEMAGEIKQHLPRAEFKRQFENVFGSNFKAFLEQQETDARRLLNHFIYNDGFYWANDNDVYNVLYRVNHYESSVLEKTIAGFQRRLEDYVKTHPVYNPFLFQHACATYRNNQYAWNSDKRSLFARLIVNLIQKNSSSIWLKHYVEGIPNRAQKIGEHALASRTFLFANSVADIRFLFKSGSWIYKTNGLHNGSRITLSVDVIESASKVRYIEEIILDKNTKLKALATSCQSHQCSMM